MITRSVNAAVANSALSSAGLNRDGAAAAHVPRASDVNPFVASVPARANSSGGLWGSASNDHIQSLVSSSTVAALNLPAYLPALPTRFILQIRRGEFINFHALFTSIATGMAPCQQSNY